jgi:hypothetical protein
VVAVPYIRHILALPVVLVAAVMVEQTEAVSQDQLIRAVVAVRGHCQRFKIQLMALL